MSMSRRNAAEASGAILILSSKDLQTVMRFDDYVDAVAEAFRMLAEVVVNHRYLCKSV